MVLLNPQASQQQTATGLAATLEQAEVPVKSVRAIKKYPLQIEIVLQSSSRDTQATQDDLWYRFIASRTAALAYLTGSRVDSYRLILLNAAGEVISSEWVYLDPTAPSQNLTVPKPLATDDSQVWELLGENLDTFGMNIVYCNVTAGKAVRENTRLVELTLVFLSDENASGAVRVTA